MNNYSSQPKVKVGILTADEITFTFHGTYSGPEGSITGTHTARRTSDNRILIDNKCYDEIVFRAASSDATFEIADVVIGVEFHWERKENQTFRGDLGFLIEHGMVAVDFVDVEDYLTSVISSEMSATASPALLEAHAVISRSWLLAQIEKHERISSNAGPTYSAETLTDTELTKWWDREDHVRFHVCADDHCQRYQGITRQVSPKAAKAVEATSGMVLSMNNELCDARFSKCCGGVFEEFQNCWEPVRHPYLVARRDWTTPDRFPDLTIDSEAARWINSRPEAFCNTSDAEILGQVLNNYDQETTDFYRWEVTYTRRELSELVRERSGIDFGDIISLEPIERGTSGRITRLKITGTRRTLIIGKELTIRRFLSTSHLYSSAFNVTATDDAFTLHGAGWGHGVGLCQIGAAVMGARGYSSKAILEHYYPGAELIKLY